MSVRVRSLALAVLWSAELPRQHRISLRRMAELGLEVLAVGHGEPITAGAAARLRSLTENL